MIRSCTSFCDPKPIATPTMPAPASSGAMLMPISLRIISPATTAIVISSVVRSSGSSVRRRADLASWASRCSRSRWCCTADVDRFPHAERQRRWSPAGFHSPTGCAAPARCRSARGTYSGHRVAAGQAGTAGRSCKRRAERSRSDDRCRSRACIQDGHPGGSALAGRMTRSTTPSRRRSSQARADQHQRGDDEIVQQRS